MHRVYILLRFSLIAAFVAFCTAASIGEDNDANQASTCESLWDCDSGIPGLSLDDYAACGDLMPILSTADEPSVTFNEANSEKNYLLMMVDPDANYYVHWVVNDIKGSGLQKGDLSSGDVVIEYKGPSPPVGETHRYELLLFTLCPEGTPISGLPEARSRFDFANFITSNNLCDEIAARFEYRAGQD